MARWSSPSAWTKLLHQLVAIPSITGSAAERQFPQCVAGWLKELEYFRRHPDHLTLYPTPDKRSALVALVRSDQVAVRKTVVLLSHFDVVAVDDYGSYADLAFDLDALSPSLSRDAEHLPTLVQSQLASGTWLFGRGIMDMKAGLAHHLAILAEAAQEEMPANIVMVSVPDEEAHSLGARTVAALLLQWRQRWALDYCLMVNSEPIFAQSPDAQDHVIYTGSIGKALAGFYCYGAETHVGEPWSGINADFMVSHIARELELNADFCDQVDTEWTPPPTVLKQSDLRRGYSVQTPFRAVLLANVLLFQESTDLLLQRLREVANRARQAMTEDLLRKLQALPNGVGEHDLPSIRIITYAELRTHIEEYCGPEAVRAQEQQILAQTTTFAHADANRAHLFGTNDPRDNRVQLVDAWAQKATDWAPMIVLFFAPPYYPAVDAATNPTTAGVIQHLKAYTWQTHHIDLKTQHYYPGLSDLSFFYQPSANANALYANLVGVEDDPAPRLSMPIINLGPMGRDAHQSTERLEMQYSREILGDLLRETIRWVLSMPELQTIK
ncbi:MAG: hypothetical protein C7B45_01050 [Sulfobacillus acidophilus]|uniref:Peptidase M20 n=1 Tax=Sulfobacillus acidophilus TaxID=53633 RepID=A0A2T2WNU6_9FIRM|nr:MAG: hypothetical protein C7B45_01050 [Sulfobacillus acidophilus]